MSSLSSSCRSVVGKSMKPIERERKRVKKEREWDRLIYMKLCRQFDRQRKEAKWIKSKADYNNYGMGMTSFLSFFHHRTKSIFIIIIIILSSSSQSLFSLSHFSNSLSLFDLRHALYGLILSRTWVRFHEDSRSWMILPFSSSTTFFFIISESSIVIIILLSLLLLNIN